MAPSRAPSGHNLRSSTTAGNSGNPGNLTLPPRRHSRRLAREDVETPATIEPPKKRRKTAKKNLSKDAIEDIWHETDVAILDTSWLSVIDYVLTIC